MTTYEIYNFCENLYHKDSDYHDRLWSKIEEWYSNNFTLYTLEQTLNTFDEEDGLVAAFHCLLQISEKLGGRPVPKFL